LTLSNWPDGSENGTTLYKEPLWSVIWMLGLSDKVQSSSRPSRALECLESNIHGRRAQQELRQLRTASQAAVGQPPATLDN
jgi:hypothetical protein